VRIVVDPIFGDDPKGFYVAGEVVEAMTALLVPEADVLTPNRFELSALAGFDARSMEEAADAARRLAAARPGRRVIATSPPLGPDETGALVADAGSATLFATRLRAGAPNGAGDTLSALIAAGRAPGAALGALDALVTASLGRPHLAFAAAPAWIDAPPIPGAALG
jgi:pyridoxine kinase